MQVQGMEVVITPYDYTAPPETTCTRQLVSMEHEKTIHFGASGTARILVQGLDHRQRSAENMAGDTIIVERVVVIP